MANICAVGGHQTWEHGSGAHIRTDLLVAFQLGHIFWERYSFGQLYSTEDAAYRYIGTLRWRGTHVCKEYFEAANAVTVQIVGNSILNFIVHRKTLKLFIIYLINLYAIVGSVTENKWT